ncbi:MAG: hypothetical protein JWN00_1662 [Actinomycetia bacterium]|jgi:mRNA interferase MazF|nr:hypothetical protein [Actinomycetes bacterium]
MKAAQGEIWLADYGTPVGREQGFLRPALVLNGSMLDTHRMELVVAVPLTTANRGWVTHVEMTQGVAGLRKTSWAMAEQIRSLSTTRLRRRIGLADEEAVGRVLAVMQHLLDMP